ncbi:MAG: RidA family protein [Pseudomonadota bacterium]
MPIEQRLSDLGVNLPEAAAPAANYVPFVRTGNQLFVSGQVPFLPDGSLHGPGKLGDTMDVEAGQTAAKMCAIGVLAQAKVALNGDWTRLTRLVKIVGFVNATLEFTDHPKVVNGASDFLVDVLGDQGKHARSAVGVASLPFGVPVEVEAIFEIT